MTTRTILALFLAALIGCAHAVPFSECGPSTACPDGTVCQQVSPQHASCTTLCEVDSDCDGGARCFLGPYRDVIGREIRLCRLPCDAERWCPDGLSCEGAEWREGVSLWCM